MRCPFCGHDDTQVKDSRPSEDGTSIRRRRACPECDSRFTTFERIQTRDLMVVKRNGDKRPFDREKLLRSISIATRKRPITTEDIENLVNNIVRTMERTGETEVSSEQLGGEVMEALASMDKVAYIRFASVYKDFSHSGDYEEFISKLGN